MGATSDPGSGNSAADAATGVSRLLQGIMSWGASEIPHLAQAVSAKSGNFVDNYYYPNANRGW